MDKIFDAFAQLVEKGWRFGVVLVSIAGASILTTSADFYKSTDETRKALFVLGAVGLGLIFGRIAVDFCEYFFVKLPNDIRIRKEKRFRENQAIEFCKCLDKAELYFMYELIKAEKKYHDVDIDNYRAEALLAKDIIRITRPISAIYAVIEVNPACRAVLHERMTADLPKK